MKFLVFQHVPHEHPGYIADFAEKNDIRLDIVRLWKPYKIPSLSSYNALIIMGGPMGVYEESNVFPSKDDEINVIRQNVGKIPILGFCLGSQLLAYTLGAKVYPNIIEGKHKKEISYYTLNLTKKGQEDILVKNFPEKFKVLEWHGDVFDIPKGATLLASSSLCKNQAFSYKNAYGLLFHFEFTPEMVERQIEIDKEWIHKDFNMNEKNLIQEAKDLSKLMKKQSELLLTNFLTIIETEF